jgi:7-cyano-7-deazaguanine synthase
MGGDGIMKTGLLLSGGMDSIAIAFWKKPDIAFTINYGQLSAEGEIHAAETVCQSMGIQHEVITVDCSNLGSGNLSGKSPISLAPVPEWWPFRNQLLLTLAGMRAVSLEVSTLLFGSVKTDAIHADGSAAFFERMDDVFYIQEGGLRVKAPAIHLTTAELVKLSGIPRSLLAWSHSCHVSDFACGNCRGCYKYQAVMKELGYEED